MNKIIFKGKWVKEDDPKLQISDSTYLKIYHNKTIVFVYLLFILLLTFTKFYYLNSQENYSLSITIIACVIGFLILIPIFLIHEVLHAICFPKNVVKEIYFNYNKKDILSVSLMTYCEAPLKKYEFIKMLLFPNLVLSIIPMILWLVGIFDFEPIISKVLGLIISISLCGSISDLTMIISILFQVTDKKTHIFMTS
ncbi:MAG: DUF3267 domain-containing protein [Longicatena sp.]